MKNQAAIDALESRLTEFERKGNALVEVINDLRAEDGLGPRPPFGGGNGGGQSSGGTITSIKPDTFYGKKLQTAVREYLELRKAQNLGPATPREIYDSITQGGFHFDAKTADIAMVGMRALLRKRTAFFHRLPNGTYGLTSWYPDIKKPKGVEIEADDEDGDDDDVIEVDTKGTATTKKAAAAS